MPRNTAQRINPWLITCSVSSGPCLSTHHRSLQRILPPRPCAPARSPPPCYLTFVPPPHRCPRGCCFHAIAIHTEPSLLIVQVCKARFASTPPRHGNVWSSCHSRLRQASIRSAEHASDTRPCPRDVISLCDEGRSATTGRRNAWFWRLGSRGRMKVHDWAVGAPLPPSVSFAQLLAVRTRFSPKLRIGDAPDSEVHPLRPRLRGRLCASPSFRSPAHWRSLSMFAGYFAHFRTERGREKRAA